MFDRLFSPIRIRGVELKNRVVMTAMGTHFADKDCFVTEQLIEYHAVRAKGGCGLNTVECCAINPDSAPERQLSIAEDCYIEGHRKLTDAIHENGGKAALQLWQGGAGAGSDPKCRIFLADAYDGKHGPVMIAPTAKREADGTIPAVTAEELKMIAVQFGEAAKRAAQAGYDIVEFHCGHNYLPHCMLSKGFNHRTDEYGGSLENRMRFPLMCIDEIRKNIPEDMPLFMRVSAFDEADVDDGRGGNSIEETIEFCRRAKEKGVDVVNVSRGDFTGLGNCYEVPPNYLPNGFNVENAARFKKETGMITMAVGRINRAEQGEEILENEKADLICMARAQLADPEFCNKAKAGKCDEIRHCIGCDQGCSEGFVALPHITCLRNPFVGKEYMMKVIPAETKKKVLVAGGGMGGMECALFLKERGHEPVIVEKEDRLGGQFVIAGTAPHKKELYLAVEEEERLVRKAGIEVRLGTEVTKELIEELRPDEAVIATGAGPLILPLPGKDLPHVMNSHDVLAGKAKPYGKVAVIGGGLVGVEVAEYLHEKGLSCAILEMRPEIAADLGYVCKIFANIGMAQNGTECVTDAVCTEITEHGVIYRKDGELHELACDSVVMAAGARSLPNEEIRSACEELGIPYHVIGDAVKPRRALDAVAEGVETALAV